MSQPDMPAHMLKLELAGQKPPPDPMDELKKKAKAWAKRYVLTPLGVLGISLSSGWVGWQAAKGDVQIDMSDVVNVVLLATCAYVFWMLSRKPKGK